MLLSPKHLPRLAAIVGCSPATACVTSRSSRACSPLAPSDDEELPPDDWRTSEANAQSAFRKRLVELGPAYVKLGQVLSTRPDLLPAPYIHELEQLQDDVGPIPLDEVEEIDRGGARRTHQQAVRLRSTPSHSARASLGQVHARAAARRTRGRRQGAAPEHPRVARRRHRVLPRARAVHGGAHRASGAARRPRRRHPAARARARRRAGLPHRGAQRGDVPALARRVSADSHSEGDRGVLHRARAHDGARPRREDRRTCRRSRASSTTSRRSPRSSRARTSRRSRSTDSSTPIRIRGTCSS